MKKSKKKSKPVSSDDMLQEARLSLQNGDLELASRLVNKILERSPDHIGANGLLGAIYLLKSNFNNAMKHLQIALVGAPHSAIVHNNIGVVYKKMGQLDSAKVHFRRALNNEPDHVEAMNNLGTVFVDQEDYEAAYLQFHKALEIMPNHIGSLVNMAGLLYKTGKCDRAMEYYLTVMKLDPGHHAAKAGLAKYFQDKDDKKNAVKFYEAALSAAPDNSVIHANYAIALREFAQYEAAIDHFRKAIELNSNNVDARVNYASLLNEIGKFDESLEHGKWLVERYPLNEIVNSNLLFGINYHPYLDAKEIFSFYQEWEARLVKDVTSVILPVHHDACSERRLKIGYVSPDFRDHVVHFFIEPLLENHRHEDYEIYAYAELDKIDHVSLRSKKLVDHWRETKDWSDDELAAQICEDKIDILVDLAGHTKGNRLMVFARKPAPVQVSWLGYGYTTGLTAIDYFLTNEDQVPNGYGDIFSEQVYRLPRIACCYRPPLDVPEVVRTPALKKGHVTFGSLSRTIRLNDLVVSLWAKILLAVPMSVLVLDNKPFAEEETREIFRKRFAEHGIAEERLILSYSKPHWQAYQQIDITLDPFPHNGGTSTLESLLMGTPVVTMADRPSVGRIGAAFLYAVGMSEWIAVTELEYLKIAIDAAQNIALLDEIRQGLRQRLLNSPCMDEVGFTKELEEAYRTMWRSWCQKQKKV